MNYKLSDLNEQGIPSLLEGINTKSDWEQKVDSIRQKWSNYIGTIPDRVPVNYWVTSEIQEKDHVRQHIVYDTVYGDQITAYLLVPNDTGKKVNENIEFPAVMALHPTNAIGKESVATSFGKLNRTYGLELVSRGYVVLAPDSLTSGERILEGYKHFNSNLFYERYPEWSMVAKNLTDHIQGLDVLCSLPYVDNGRIAAVGHSFGAYNAYFLAGVDQRIKTVICSCGLSPFTGDPWPEQWGLREWFPYHHIPKVQDTLDEDQIPFEFHEIAALCAPTPFFNYSAQNDKIFPHWKSIGDAAWQLNNLYQWMDSGERFRSYIGAGEHDFPYEMREIAYDFLEQWLS